MSNADKYVLCGLALEFEGTHIDLGTSGTLTEWFKILKDQDKLDCFIHWGILVKKTKKNCRIKTTGLKLEPNRYAEQFKHLPGLENLEVEGPAQRVEINGEPFPLVISENFPADKKTKSLLKRHLAAPHPAIKNGVVRPKPKNWEELKRILNNPKHDYGADWDQGKQETIELKVVVESPEHESQGDFTAKFGEHIHYNTPKNIRSYFLQELLNLHLINGELHLDNGKKAKLYMPGLEKHNNLKNLNDIIGYMLYLQKTTWKKSLKDIAKIINREKGLS